MFKRLLTYLLRIITTLLVLMIGGAAVLLYTEPGRTWLAEAGLEAVASRLDYQLTWRGIHSPEANQWNIDALTLHQDNAVDLNLSGIRLRWWPGSILAGRIILDELNIDQLVINNMQSASDRPNRTASPLPVTVHSFSIGTLTLNPPVVADTRSYHLSGDLTLFDGNTLLKTNTAITPAVANGFKLSLAATVNHDLSGSVSGLYDEQAAGPVSTLLRLPDAEPFAASLQTEFSPEATGFSVDVRDLAFVVHNHDVALRGRLQKAGDIYTLDTLRIDVDNSEQLLTGTIDRNALDLRLALDDLPLDLASAWTGRSMPGGASGQLTIQGTLNTPRVSGNLSAATRYKSVPLSVTLAATATRGQLTLQQTTVTTETGATATAAGSIDLAGSTVDIRVDLNGLSTELLQQLTSSVPADLTGNINGRIGLKGAWRTPAIDFNGRFNGNYRNTTPVVLSISGDGKPYTANNTAGIKATYEANLRRFDLQIEKHNLTGAGHMLLATDPFAVAIDNTKLQIAGTVHDLSGTIQGKNLALNLNLKDFPLNVISPLIDKPLSGALSGQVFLGGTFSEPLLTGSFNSNLVYRGIPLRAQSGFDASRKWIELRQLKIANDQTDVSAEGMLDLVNNESNLKVSIKDIDTETLGRLGLAVPDKLRGRLRSDMTVKGSWQQPQVSGEAHFSGTWQDVAVAILLTGGGDRERFVIDKLEINSGNDGTLLVHGNYKNRLADFTMEAHELPAGLLRWGEWQLPDGIVNANMTMQGSIEQPRAEGKLVFLPVAPAEGKAAPQTSLVADIKLDNSLLDTRLTLTGDNTHSGFIKLSIPWRRYLHADINQPLPLFGNLQAQTSLEDICLFLLDTDIHSCRGALQADLSLGGTYNLPELNGTLNLSDGYYENLQSGTNLHDMQIDIRAQGRELQIVKATATDGEQGQIELSGKGQWRKDISDNDINLLLKVNNSHVLRRYDMDGIANGVLTLTGNHKELFLSGTLKFQPFTLAMQSLLQQEIPTLDITDDDQQRREEAARQKRQMLPTVHMNVDLTADQQAFLRGPGLEAELQGKLQIQGTYAEPVFRGHFKTVRGSVRILGKRFVLNDGELRLEDQVMSLLIPATYTSKDLEVRAELSGTLDELHLSLSSTPSYPEDEIISQLLFGKSSQNVTPLQAIRLANAITTFKRGGRPLFDPLGTLEKALSLDRLTVEDNGNSNGLMLGAGKYINEKVYVEIETGTGAGEGWQGNVEVELLPHLNLENSINSESGFGNIGINWKKDY